MQMHVYALTNVGNSFLPHLRLYATANFRFCKPKLYDIIEFADVRINIFFCKTKHIFLLLQP